jgi:DNA-directed RNA polymerase subunit RPC12/RpoP
LPGAAVPFTCYVESVAEVPGSDTTYEVVCLHCGQEFQAEPLTGAAARYAGFKCPHCGLLVPYERADEEGALEEAADN